MSPKTAETFIFIVLIFSQVYQYFSLSNAPTLVVIDGFSEYLSGHCRSYCKQHDIRLIEAVSPYICEIFRNQGKDVPESLKAPVLEDDIIAWAIDNGIVDEIKDSAVSTMNRNGNTYVISESDSGVSTAEKISSVLELSGNGLSPHLRNKYQSNQRAKAAGLEVLRQKLISSLEEGLSFVGRLWADTPENQQLCVIKPYRGVASDGVYLCRSTQDVEVVFKKLFGQPKYGGGVNDKLLIQEYADGVEYAVDTIAQDGDIKVVALWKYHKLEVNGAPFVYQCSELIPCDGAIEREVCDYCINVLQSQDLCWGPTHTEIKYTSKGPRLIEINARWHAQHFEPIVKACLGYDAVTSTLDAFFSPEDFEKVPRYPSDMSGYGRILHLISTVEGTVTRINHIQYIEDLPSTLLVNIEPDIGDFVSKTRDIRTDCGYVLLQHDDKDQLEEDYKKIVELQRFLFEVDGGEGGVMGSVPISPSHTETRVDDESPNIIDSNRIQTDEAIDYQAINMPSMGLQTTLHRDESPITIDPFQSHQHQYDPYSHPFVQGNAIQDLPRAYEYPIVHPKVLGVKLFAETLIRRVAGVIIGLLRYQLPWLRPFAMISVMSYVLANAFVIFVPHLWGVKRFLLSLAPE